MKPAFKQICIIIFLLSFNKQGIAQISIGIKGHISTIGAPLIAKQDFFSKKLRPTLNPGVSIFGEYKLNKFLAIQPEIAYRQNQSHFQLHSSPQTIHTSIISYIRMPLLFKCSQNQKWINLIVFGGPNFGYAVGLNSVETIDEWLANKTVYTKLDFKEYQISRFDFALTAGIGIEKTIANKFRTSLDIRYDLGLTDIIKAPFYSYVNRGIALEMGILIPISGKKKNEKTSD